MQYSIWWCSPSFLTCGGQRNRNVSSISWKRKQLSDDEQYKHSQLTSRRQYCINAAVLGQTRLTMFNHLCPPAKCTLLLTSIKIRYNINEWNIFWGSCNSIHVIFFKLWQQTISPGLLWLFWGRDISEQQSVRGCGCRISGASHLFNMGNKHKTDMSDWQQTGGRRGDRHPLRGDGGKKMGVGSWGVRHTRVTHEWQDVLMEAEMRDLCGKTD